VDAKRVVQLQHGWRVSAQRRPAVVDSQMGLTTKDASCQLPFPLLRAI